ncbi:MAG: hypothetical protein OHK0041_24540 [Anaerolineales bacterium]
MQINPGTINIVCTEKSFEDLDPDGEQAKQSFTYGLAVGFIPQNASTVNKISIETFWVNANKQSTLNLLFWYPEGNEEELNLRLFVLLDERQLDNALPDSVIFSDINLQPGDYKSIPITIPPISPGAHDVIVVAIPSPENDPDVYGIVDLIYKRITLIAEPAPAPPFRNIDFASLPPEGSLKRNDPAMALEVTLKKDGIDVWNWPQPWLDIQENTPLTFYALAGHQDVTNLDAPDLEPLKSSFSAFLLFVDYQQVEIAPAQPVLYAKMDSDTAYARIPITIAPLPPGKHHLLVLRIDTPGVPMCILRGDPQSRILPNSVYGKLVGINVLPDQ